MPASEEDLSQIAFLENAIEGPDAASLKTLQARLLMFEEGFLVAKINSRIVGYLETCLWQKETPEFSADPDFFFNEHRISAPFLYLIFVGVEERQRLHGIGTKLVREAFKVAQAFSAQRVQAVSRDPIIHFYESLGFSATKQLPGFLPDNQTYTLMEFALG